MQPRDGSNNEDDGFGADPWEQTPAKTKYLGEHEIALYDTATTLLDKEHFHIFSNEYSFLDLEERYVKTGGAFGASTLYLFRELIRDAEERDEAAAEAAREDSQPTWQLAGVVSAFKTRQPGVYVNLGSSFTALDESTVLTNEFQLRFYQKECLEFLDEYMLIDGNQLVKRVGASAQSPLQ